MALAPILTLVSATSDAITVKDSTGSYSTSNPGGFGTPNPSTSDVSRVILRLTTLDQLDNHIPYLLTNPSSIIGVAGGLALVPANFSGIGDTFPDAVYDLKFDVCTTFGIVTITPGSTAFTVSNADTLFAGAIGLLMTGLDGTRIWFFDETKPLTSTGGWVTEPFPSDSAEIAQATLIVWEGGCKAMIDQAGVNCLQADIAAWSDRDCAENNFRNVWDRYKLRLSAEAKYSQGQYIDAHNEIVKLASYCGSSKCGCGCS